MPSKEDLKNYMPEEPGEKEGVLLDRIATFKADTLEELADKLHIKDKENFLATVQRYNELAKAGKDEDFGVKPENLVSIDQPPFYGTHRQVRLTQICSGVNINADYNCLDEKDQPIPGLYAIGNLAGNFYGAADYPLSIAGLNLCNNYTQGYTVGKFIAKN